MLFSPQQSRVAEKESIDVIFYQSSSDLDMEVYETSCLEKQREKAKKPSSLRSLIKGFKLAPMRGMSLIQSTLIMGSHPNNRFGKITCEEVNYNFQEDL